MPACSQCIEQTSRARHDEPHPALVLERETSYPSLYGLTSHAVYKCNQCGATMHCLSGNTDEAPFWMTLN
jgi:hypothetical protein